VSESGGGKSTLVNLILGLYEPSAGSIVVAGNDTKQLTTDQLRASVGVVFQEASLFSGTVRENIAYANPDVPMAEVIAAAKRRMRMSSSWDSLTVMTWCLASGACGYPVGNANASLSLGRC
jgi:hypothetical protein